MPTGGPYELNPRQLRSLVMLLVLLPLLPTAFVVRFLVEAISSEKLESRERIRPAYAQLLKTSSETLAAAFSKQLPTPRDGENDVGARPASLSGESADALLAVAPDGTLSRWKLPLPPPLENLDGASSEHLVKGILDARLRYAGYPSSGAVRWRFLAENPEPIFALHPGGNNALDGPTMLLIKTRRHLLDVIGGFYSRTLDAQSVLRLVDENGDETSLVGPSDVNSGDFLAETILPPPLPAWRVRIYSVDASFIDGIAREQISFYIWTVGGMVLVTGTVAGLAGLLLRRRIALHEMRNDILAIVSHEIRTPLASVRMFIETLLEHRYHGGQEQADEYLRLIQQENSRLERLAEGFLTLSRLDGQRRSRHGGLKLIPVDADALCLEAAERLRPRLDAPGCCFTIEAAAGSASLAGDADALLVVLVNLLENALKYTGEEKQITLRTSINKGQVCFEVSDNGIGIAASEQEKIFERFYQSDRRLARGHGGCGLGLSLVRSIVTAHGGTVTVQSAPGKGSTFTVRIPAHEHSESTRLSREVAAAST